MQAPGLQNLTTKSFCFYLPAARYLKRDPEPVPVTQMLNRHESLHRAATVRERLFAISKILPVTVLAGVAERKPAPFRVVSLRQACVKKMG
jgi:hypothetical protein